MVEIIPILSRTFKLKKNRKRKRGDGTDLFEVRPTNDKNGFGIFAVANIACGDLIISHEEPIIACSARPNRSICSSCSTPIGTLGKDHLKADGIDVSLPYIFDGIDSDDLVLTTSHTKCKECDDTVWCSTECFRKCQEQHCIFCKGSGPLKDFIEKEEENATILRLATKVIAVAMSHLTSLSNDKQTFIEQCFWWTEYGSHPLWWEVGAPKDDKKDITSRFCTALQKTLIEFIASKRIDVEETVVRQVCSQDTVGSILGMLQCNVMEYEFPSPAGQYLEQVFEDSCEQFAAHGQPISGSGLYPLLSLANHDCNPNASIEFLQESNRGSMVATRDIAVDEEICITYVCNGGLGGGDGAEYLRNFCPSRTWTWLNERNNEEDDEEERDEDLDDPDLDDDGKSVDESSTSSNGVSQPKQDSDSVGQSPLEGSTVEERAKSLFEYGFHCKCSTCATQRCDNTSTLT